MRALRLWLATGLCLAAVDIVLFRVGLFWWFTPDFGSDANWATWAQVYTLAREFETRAADPNTALVAGDSIVLTGVDTEIIQSKLAEQDVPADVLPVAAFGTTVTDAAILTWSSRHLDPWLVIYGLEAHNFKKPGGFITTDTPIKRVLYDSSLELPLLQRKGAEEIIDAWVRRYWKLYRYKLFAGKILTLESRRLVDAIGARLARADESVPTDATDYQRYFDPMRVRPESFAIWQRWRQSRRFEDYADFLRSGPAGDALLNYYYKLETLDLCGPQDNGHAASLDWMLDFLHRRGTRIVVLYFPENPVFRATEARPYFQPELSEAVASFAARTTVRYRGRFIDLRTFLPAEDFIDLRHPNLEGRRVLSARIAQIVAEEWRARSAEVGGP